MTDEEAWTMEQAFWTGGSEHFQDAIDVACVMAFPDPAGIISGRPAILQSLVGAPRWSSVSMTATRVARPADNLMVLAYRAEGRRDGSAAYNAYCTSTYRLFDGSWRLIQHQQTPT